MEYGSAKCSMYKMSQNETFFGVCVCVCLCGWGMTYTKLEKNNRQKLGNIQKYE